jgi:hypothetical protein
MRWPLQWFLACGSKVLYGSLLPVFALRRKTGNTRMVVTALPKAKTASRKTL